MALAVFAVYERVRLATGAVSRIGGLCDLVRRAMGSSGLHVIGFSSGFGCGCGWVWLEKLVGVPALCRLGGGDGAGGIRGL